MQIIIKTLKYAVATFAAIYIAQWLQLDYAVSAGIIAILSLAETNKATIVYIGNLTLTMLMSLLVATVVFNMLGFHILTFAIFLAIAYPLSVLLKSHSAIAPCAVSVSHLFLEQTTAFSWLMNEMLLLIIGAGIAMLVNLYQPSGLLAMEKIKGDIEAQMQAILIGMAGALNQPGVFFDMTDQLDRLESDISKGLRLANTESANQFNAETANIREYFAMRKEQLAVLFDMEEGLHKLTSETEQNYALANFLKHVGEELHEKNPAQQLQRELEKLTDAYRQSDLPRTREEFEARAILFELLADCRKFLKIKNDFYARLRIIRRHTQMLNQ